MPAASDPVTSFSADAGLRELYPPIEPYQTGYLKVSDIHTLYWETSGNPSGEPIVFVHGGPGGGCGSDDRRFFDPKHYRIILFDQRGAGKSTPPASLVDNTTWHLVSDMEILRVHLGVETWHVFGGSWGSTLSLAFAITHPERVRTLVLRGIFLLRDSEITWFYRPGGAQHIYPDFFEAYMASIPSTEHSDLVAAYHARLTSDDEAVRGQAAKSWAQWECATSRLVVDRALVAKAENPSWAMAFARIECHYFHHRGFFEKDGWLLDNVGKIRHIPAVIVQGRYDVVCPPKSAWDLHRAFPEAEFHWLQDCGHSAKEPGIRHQLVSATDKFRGLK